MNWSFKGAIQTLLDAPKPGADTVFAPDYTMVKSAREFLLTKYTEEDIAQMKTDERERQSFLERRSSVEY